MQFVATVGLSLLVAGVMMLIASAVMRMLRQWESIFPPISEQPELSCFYDPVAQRYRFLVDGKITEGFASSNIDAVVAFKTVLQKRRHEAVIQPQYHETLIVYYANTSH